MINIYKLKLTVLQQEILRFLFVKAGRSFNARNIAVSLGVSQPAVSKALPLLAKEGFIKMQKDKESKRLSIELDRDDADVIGVKRADNLRQIYECGLYRLLYNAFAGATVILFGSYAFGEDTRESDIDIAVIGAEKKALGLEKYEKLLERDIVLNHYPSFKSIDKNLLGSILNGIVLKGSVEL